MKKMISIAAIGGICLCIPAARGDGDAAPKRVVCDETCKIEFDSSKAAPSAGKKPAPAAKTPYYSVVSPVGRSAVKAIDQAPRLDTLDGKTIVVVGTNFMARVTHPEIKRLILRHYPNAKVILNDEIGGGAGPRRNSSAS